ncbi:MAG TPA: cytochrome c3 family protein [Malonomonas sp.]
MEISLNFKGMVILSYCLLLPFTSMAAENPCLVCHEEVAQKGRSGRYVHHPFLQGDCGQCHVAGQSVTAPLKKTPLSIAKKKQEKIRWFQTVSGREQEHWLRLPTDKLTSGLYLRATDGRMRSPVQEVKLPDSGRLPQKLNDNQAPQQSGISVADVRRGISTTATLQWETDEYTDATLHYGVKDLRSVINDRRLARRHSQVLLGLDADKVYQYQIISHDLHGNETRSPVLEFSTAESFLSEDAYYSDKSTLSGDIDLRWELFRVKDDYLLVVKADRPVSLSLGAENIEQTLNTVERQVASTENFSHPILKSSFDTNVTVCKACHQGVREEYSHPINVRPRVGMVIPKEYPLLPDGKISCMSCHANHASGNEYRLLKSGKADLCRGCHKDY